MDIVEKVRSGHWEYRLCRESLYFAGPSRWYVSRSKVDGDDAGKYVETYGPYHTAEEAKDAADWPKPKTEAEELWEWAKEARDLISRAATVIASIEYVPLYGDLLNSKNILDGLEAKWKTEKK